jgi:hypothetical protein
MNTEKVRLSHTGPNLRKDQLAYFEDLLKKFREEKLLYETLAPSHPMKETYKERLVTKQTELKK